MSARIITGIKKNNVAKVYDYHTQHPYPFPGIFNICLLYAKIIYIVYGFFFVQ